MLTKADFLAQVALNIDNYPTAAALYRANDPRLTVLLEGMAIQLAMLSQQLDLALAEPFDKVRDSTVLAAAAMRGIVRKATPGRVRLAVQNSNLVPVTLEAGRVVLDSDSNPYIVTVPATLPAATEPGGVLSPSTGFIDADQYYAQNFTHTATATADFYAIALPDPDDGTTLYTLTVTDNDDNPYGYRNNYINALPGDKIYTVEFDDVGVAYIRFGVDGVAGVQVQAGDPFKIYTTRTVGKLDLKANSPFALASLATSESGVNLALVELSLNQVLYSGDNPASMATLRTLCKYPAIYDDSAVFLGEFEFLVRKKYPDLAFLAVWNEAIEEAARGGSLDNINTLFVACYDSTETLLSQADPASPVQPDEVLSPTARQIAIKELILAADDSYKVKLYTPVTSKIVITVTARVSTAHNTDVVAAKITQAILTAFGQAAGNHAGKPVQRLIYALLKDKAPETNAGNAFLGVEVAELVGAFRPELWRFASTDSVTVTVTQSNVFAGGWGA
ncbi:hypothetical protein KFZ76_07090 [Methylovulum psychrotolerans]|uniref:hypothetical protein n=1 Tax=Methylovulum psychrotolerans TaxID=1704499 RepID=UPI001BFF1C61|nr:hypothetical protein [Methylovulum psychrotolerans]MBT9097476.1 hypothetical protein [Methylovulum psychrotolerans]